MVSPVSLGMGLNRTQPSRQSQIMPHTQPVLAQTGLSSLHPKTDLFFSGKVKNETPKCPGSDSAIAINPNETDKAAIKRQALEMAHQGDVANVQLLLAKGADINARDRQRNSLLQLAVQGNTRTLDPTTGKYHNSGMELIQYLLKEGANPNTSNMFGNSPLDNAITLRHDEIQEVLNYYSALTGFELDKKSGIWK